MRHRCLQSNIMVKEARDKAARDERARVRALRSSRSPTQSNRSSINEETNLKQLEESSDQPHQRLDPSQLFSDSPRIPHHRSHIENEDLPSDPLNLNSPTHSVHSSSNTEITNSSISLSFQLLDYQLVVDNPLFVLPIDWINLMADAVNQIDPLIPVTMRSGQPDDHPTSMVSLPKFYGELGSDLDYHVREFLTACNANNARTPSHWHAIFPTTFDGQTRQWFHRQPLGHFNNWTALKDAFIEKFRPVAYIDRLTEQMHDLQMITSESIDNYYGRMEYIILRLPNGHGFNDEMRKSIFIRGLIPFRLKAYIKEVKLVTLDAAYQRAKLYENIYTMVNEAPVISYINQPPLIVNQNLPMSNPVTYPPQIGVQSTIKIPNPPMVNN
jgi:hypothetical protein